MPSKSDDSLKKLKADLKDNTVGCLYLFHGEETYLLQYYLEEIRKKILTPGFETFQSHSLNGNNTDAKAIQDAVEMLPVGGDRTLITVTDYDLFSLPADQKQEICEILDDLPEYVCLIFIYDLVPYKPDARTKISKLLREKGLVVNFAKQSQNSLTDWIRRRFRALDRDIDRQTAQYLIFLCGDLMNPLIEEISKIAAYSSHPQITKEDIDAVAIPLLDTKVFQMTDAVFNRQFDQAVQSLGDLLGQQESAIMILSVLGKQLRQLYTARLGYEAGKGSQYLIEIWNMHPYPAEKLMQAAPRFSLPWCRRAVCLAADTDIAMKSSGADEQELLIDLIMELAIE